MSDHIANEEAVREITRRRTFAIISHPDAGKTTLTRMRRVGQHIQQAAGVYGFQDHFEGQSAVPQALLVRIAMKDAHFEISSINSSVGKRRGLA